MAGALISDAPELKSFTADQISEFQVLWNCLEGPLSKTPEFIVPLLKILERRHEISRNEDLTTRAAETSDPRKAFATPSDTHGTNTDEVNEWHSSEKDDSSARLSACHANTETDEETNERAQISSSTIGKAGTVDSLAPFHSIYSPPLHDTRSSSPLMGGINTLASAVSNTDCPSTSLSRHQVQEDVNEDTIQSRQTLGTFPDISLLPKDQSVMSPSEYATDSEPQSDSGPQALPYESSLSVSRVEDDELNYSDTSIDTVLTTDSFPRDTRTDDDEEVLLIDSGPQALPYCTGYQVTVPTMNDALKISSHVDMKFGELVYVADDEESYRHDLAQTTEVLDSLCSNPGDRDDIIENTSGPAALSYSCNEHNDIEQDDNQNKDEQIRRDFHEEDTSEITDI
ncbi:uncharacterized protein LOC134191435 [Corticium candelabrum]|uniref:uncharacterized protein LOC134191435 n=1 Tax=Corticium candelabrum TaxID=121492 RepID=UPI002E2768D9|nr:uncharacterized protein LOC134191435 [Corticium candelabrum]